MTPHNPFFIVYCGNLKCRVNTFEVGDEHEGRKGPGYCPACYKLGNCLVCYCALNDCGCDE